MQEATYNTQHATQHEASELRKVRMRWWAETHICMRIRGMRTDSEACI